VETVTSADGTTIAYDRVGAGPALVVVAGAFSDRKSFAALGELLSTDFAVVLYDRRGRGDSGDTPPVDVQREVEDLGAVIAAAGGSAFVFGHSSGGALTLEAAMRGLPVTALAVYEPPYVVGDDRPPNDHLAADIDAALAAGLPGEAARAFLTQVAEMPPEAVSGMEKSPAWAYFTALAPSLRYDLAVVGDQFVPTARLGSIAVPTLALSGADSPAWARHSVESVAAAIPGARVLSMAGQTHRVSQDALAPVLRDFFASATDA
jgi:pimeloyl-ACP methyl ester carboxylesterase